MKRVMRVMNVSGESDECDGYCKMRERENERENEENDAGGGRSTTKGKER